MSNTVANTILSQLGGNRFLTMTGARNLTAVESGLRMVLPITKYGKSRVSVNGTIYVLEVMLAPTDTYTVKLTASKAFKPSILGQEDDVYCDMLTDSIERLTGLATRL